MNSIVPPISRRKGVALIIVLSIMAILITLVLSFFSMVQTERQSSSSFAESVEVRNLSEIPANLVISQIRKATENNAPTSTSQQFKGWASQPGMIRVFGTETDESGIRSKPTALYKLYSDNLMVLSKENATSQSGGLSASEVQEALDDDLKDLTSWNTKPGVFVDLNEPVAVPGPTPTFKFPIVDPRASVAGDGAQSVDGFKYTTTEVTGTTNAENRSDINARLPMPVRWIYMLRDGTLIHPSEGTQTTTTFEASGSINGQIPTADNPIVGRIAFWADDDTSKVNVNTASEGAHWDTPVANNPIDRDYALKVPAQNEFSRYPGHPAATSLSTVFQGISEAFYVNSAAPTSSYKSAFEAMHKISPRVPWGGTLAGTETSSGGDSGLPAKNNRLYVSVDEIFLDPVRELNLPELKPQSLEFTKFFLTAHSRAPELNLFGKPRINLWPSSENSSHRNPKDKLLAFMSETMSTDKLNARKWYFQRKTNFISQTSPGSSQDTTSDYSIQRNRDMMEKYMPYLLGRADNGKTYSYPGFASKSGGRDHTFAAKYAGLEINTSVGTKLDQIMVEMVDLMRWGINGYSTVSKSGWPSYTYLPDRVSGNRGQSSAVPLMARLDNNSGGAWLGRGVGRWPTITEAAIVFMRTAASTDTSGGKMRAFLVLEGFSPTNGPPSHTPNINYEVTGLNKFKVKFLKAGESGGGAGSAFASLGFVSPINNPCTITGGDAGCTPFAYVYNSIAGKGTSGNLYPLAGTEVEIPKDADGFTFLEAGKPSGSDNGFGYFIIKTKTNWGSPVEVQQVQMQFEPINRLKLPRASSSMDFVSRFAGDNAGNMQGQLIRDGDITRSIEPNVNAKPQGDLRFYAAVPLVPKDWFKHHPYYFNPDQERLHFLRHGNSTESGQFGPGFATVTDPTLESTSPGDRAMMVPRFNAAGSRQSTSDTAGTLLPNFTYAKGAAPAVPRGLNGAFQQTLAGDFRPGDWDNGIGIIEDGPYVRKPDEGNSRFANNSIAPQNSTYMGRHYFDKEAGSSYSPLRQVASAVMFGSLPTGLHYTYSGGKLKWDPEFQRPWRTLLFCPNPASRSTSANQEPGEADHVGFRGPRDHILLDLFWMPVTEPYAISEPFSTAGKVNMNYQMVPFSHIERSTGIRAVLKSTRVTAIPPSSGGGDGLFNTTAYNMSNPYKKQGAGTSAHSSEFRYAVNADLTLDGFKQRFSKGDVFRSASEICEIFLVPKRIQGSNYGGAKAEPTSYDQMTQWWNGSLAANDAFELTGDNTREAPYNHVYPRLTTKSNTFTVHYRVQTLQKARSSAPAEWSEIRDTVASEYRGSTTLERYLDPNDAGLSSLNIGSNTFNVSYDSFYRIRIIQRKQFVP